MSPPLDADSLEQPCEGDVVVAPGEESRPGVYTLRQAPGLAQVTVGSRSDALVLARAFARRFAVNAWLDEGDTVVQIETCRLTPAAAVRAVSRT